jgi:hypothetical protein
MSKSRKYPIDTNVFQSFLSEKEYHGIFIDSEFTTHEKKDIQIKVPHLTLLTKKQVTTLLKQAKLSIEDFEGYLETIQTDGLFDQMIEMSLKTPSLKKEPKKPK